MQMFQAFALQHIYLLRTVDWIKQWPTKDCFDFSNESGQKNPKKHLFENQQFKNFTLKLDVVFKKNPTVFAYYK